MIRPSAASGDEVMKLLATPHRCVRNGLGSIDMLAYRYDHDIARAVAEARSSDDEVETN